MEDIKCVYWGIFFSSHDLPTGQLSHEIEDKHVTFAFRSPCPVSIIGQSAAVTVNGYGNNGENEALSVELGSFAYPLYNRDEIPHITLSVENGAHPKDSAFLEFEEIEPYTVYGVFGYYGFDQMVHTF